MCVFVWLLELSATTWSFQIICEIETVDRLQKFRLKHWMIALRLLITNGLQIEITRRSNRASCQHREWSFAERGHGAMIWPRIFLLLLATWGTWWMGGWNEMDYLDNKYLRPLLPGACPCPCLAISCLGKNVHSPIQQENQAFIIISKKIKPRALSIFARICWLGIAFPLSYSVTTWKIMSDLTIRIIQRCSLNVVQVHF